MKKLNIGLFLLLVVTLCTSNRAMALSSPHVWSALSDANAFALTTSMEEETPNTEDYDAVDGTIARDDRKINSLSVSYSDGTNSQSVSGISTSNPRSVYQNLSSQVLTFEAGSTLKLTVNWTGSWMHGYVYVDYDKDGAFSYSLNDAGTPADGSELVSFTYYDEAESNPGKNSLGESSANNSGVGTNIPVFTLPSDLTPGYYRIRFKIDWNCLDPSGNTSTKNPITSNGGDIIDFTLKVEEAVSTAYDKYGKPGISSGGNKRAQSQGEILNATGVLDDSTSVYNPAGDTGYQAWSNEDDMVKVQAGATFDFKVTYGTDGWNDLTVFMLREDGTSSKLYGAYEGSWSEGGNSNNLFYNIEAAEDNASADATAGTATFPITLPDDLTEGETVLIRFLIHGSDVGDNPNTQDISEGSYCDYLFYVPGTQLNTDDYDNVGGTVSRPNNDRYINSLTVSDGTNSQSVEGISKASDRSVYQNLSSQVLTFTAGSTLKLTVDWSGSWMHGYVYVDYDKSGAFSTDGNELVSYTYYNGVNSEGATTTDNSGVGDNIPAFTLPSDLAPGYYRIRFKLDWNNLDPLGSSSSTTNAGDIIDFTLKVEAPTTEPEPDPEPSTALSEILATNHGLVRLSVLISSTRGDTDFYATQYEENIKGVAETGANDQIWLIEAQTGGGYTMRSMSTGKYVAAPISASGVSLQDTPSTLYIAASTVEGLTDRFVISSSATFDDGTCFYYDGEAVYVSGNNKDEAYAAWSITAASATDLIKYYKVRNNSYTTHYLTESWTDKNMTGAVAGSAETQTWKFIKIGEKYNIQSVSSKNYIQADPGQSKRFLLDTTPVYFSLAEADGTYGIYHEDGEGRGLHEDASQRIVSWNYSADASRWVLEEVELSAEEIAALEEAYHNAYGQWGSAETSERFLSFFNDAAATELKSNYQSMSDTELRAAMSGIATELQDVAIKVKNNSWAAWEKEFRVAEYGAFSNASYWAGVLNTFNYGSINNPTGIVANNGGKVIIIVGSDIPADATLSVTTRCKENIADCSSSGISPQTLSLKKGLNYLPCTTDGSHIYINYISKNGDLIENYPKLDIHVIGGSVQGYVDINKHDDANWASMKSNGLFTAAPSLDLLGNYAQLHISQNAATQNGDEIIPLIEVFDWYVYTELELMGITAVPDSMKNVEGASDAYEDLYPKKVNNRMVCFGINNGYLHGGPGHICINGDGNFSYKALEDRGASAWGAAHEYGHINQGSILLLGSREVSNNLFSNVMLHKGGTCTSRGWSLNFLQGYMQEGNHNWPHIVTNQYWCGTHMFHQLYLYYHAAGNDPLFYQKLFKLLRANPLNPPTGDGGCSGSQDYLKFALLACQAANEDLTDFFEYWGFFEPVSNVAMSDYPTGRNWVLTTTQDEIDATKEAMAAYEKKGNAAMMFIEDRAVESYKENGDQKDSFDGTFTVNNCATKFPGAQYSAFNGTKCYPQNIGYTLSGYTMEVASSTSAAGIKFYNSEGKLVYAAAEDVVVIPDAILTQIDHSKTVVVLTDGTKIPLYNTADEDLYQLNVHDVDGGDYTRYVKETEENLFLANRDGANAVALLYTKDGGSAKEAPEDLAKADNVAVDGNFYNLKLTDKMDFYGVKNTSLSATNISYNRDNTAGFNSVCLPFALKLTDLPGCKIEVLSGSIDGTVLFDDTVTEVAAGTPCLVWCPDDVTEWSLSLTGNREVVSEPKVVTAGDFTMKGSFKNDVIGADKYKLNSAGTKFGKTTDAGKITAFRLWMETKSTSANSFNIKHGGIVSDLTSPVFGRPESDIIYDLSGRPVARPERGRIYIKNGRTVLIK